MVAVGMIPGPVMAEVLVAIYECMPSSAVNYGVFAKTSRQQSRLGQCDEVGAASFDSHSRLDFSRLENEGLCCQSPPAAPKFELP